MECSTEHFSVDFTRSIPVDSRHYHVPAGTKERKITITKVCMHDMALDFLTKLFNPADSQRAAANVNIDDPLRTNDDCDNDSVMTVRGVDCALISSQTPIITSDSV